jgi:hypothetical protein
MGAALAVTGLIGGGISALGGMQSAEAQKQNLFYQAAVAANNAQIARQNAEMETQTGQSQMTMEGMKNRSIIGTMKAGQAASGVDVNTGSFVNARAGAAEIGALNQATIGSNAARKAYGFQVQAMNDLAQSQMDIRGGQQVAAAAPLTAFGSLLSSASSVGGKYFGYQSSMSDVLGSNPLGSFFGGGIPAASAGVPMNEQGFGIGPV